MTHLSPAPPESAAQPSLTIVPYSDPQARRLTQALHLEQLATYGFADDPDDTPEEQFHPPQGLFVITHRDGIAVGCGGVRLLDANTAEIKRMYVAAVARGQGLGRHILEHLERHAASSGASRILLETGARNHAALALYRRCGYVPVPSYAPGRNPAVNRAMHRVLSQDRACPATRDTGGTP
ncbi:GNAT family N-acetyltransferase [Streptomyces europaeiscabiei]|uniref:GNAT family N-acetyltransferase n=1 Tax=Streptomyces europaeiscabiei TaxID=146819 RepID=UPI0029A5F44F|nr:GNAT family N-acetyltransferase [Streptomyces europaeiscabiei]MDX3694810.1 GNAT family N-acetyltransferase [Streptomyces europaeiscabiei]